MPSQNTPIKACCRTVTLTRAKRLTTPQWTPLWFFEAARAYLAHTGDLEFVRDELYRVFACIISCHVPGARYGIKVDDESAISRQWLVRVSRARGPLREPPLSLRRRGPAESIVSAMVVCGPKATKQMIVSTRTIKITIDYGSIGELRFVQLSRKRGHCVNAL